MQLDYWTLKFYLMMAERIKDSLAHDKPSANGEKMVIKQAADVLRTEAEGILGLVDSIDRGFVEMVEIICRCKGRVIVSGIGKSGLIGRKIVATLNSTGTRSLFLHPVEAMHGDLGMVSKDDVFIALSTSGETDELNMLLPTIRKMGCPVIAFTGKHNSTLAKGSDIVINVGVKREACPLGLAPTASSTAMLAMGDALAVVLINKKKFKSSDFKKFHPGGALGQRLASKVRDIMLTGEAIPWVAANTDVNTALREMDRHSLGVILVLTADKHLLGIITDGDIRRAVARRRPLLDRKVEQIMTPEPHFLKDDTPAYDALNLMEQHQITVLPIIDNSETVCGILHLHDILGKGEFKFNGS